MNAPLWRIMLGILILALVAHRAATGVMLALDDQSALLVATLGAQCIAGLVLWVGLLWVTPLVVPALIALGVTISAGAIVGGFLAQIMAPSVAVSQIVVALVGTALFAFIARRAIEHDSSSS